MNQLTKKMTRLFLLLLLLGGCLSVGRMTAYAADETTAAATEETSGGEVSGDLRLSEAPSAWVWQ